MRKFSFLHKGVLLKGKVIFIFLFILSFLQMLLFIKFIPEKYGFFYLFFSIFLPIITLFVLFLFRFISKVELGSDYLDYKMVECGRMVKEHPQFEIDFSSPNKFFFILRRYRNRYGYRKNLTIQIFISQGGKKIIFEYPFSIVKKKTFSREKNFVGEKLRTLGAVSSAYLDFTYRKTSFLILSLFCDYTGIIIKNRERSLSIPEVISIIKNFERLVEYNDLQVHIEAFRNREINFRELYNRWKK